MVFSILFKSLNLLLCLCFVVVFLVVFMIIFVVVYAVYVVVIIIIIMQHTDKRSNRDTLQFLDLTGEEFFFF